MGGIDLCFWVLYHLCCVEQFSACNLKKFLANSCLYINIVSKLCVIRIFTFPLVKFLDHISILAHILCIIGKQADIARIVTVFFHKRNIFIDKRS